MNSSRLSRCCLQEITKALDSLLNHTHRTEPLLQSMHRFTLFGVLTLFLNLVLGSSITFAQTNIANPANGFTPSPNSGEVITRVTSLFTQAKALSQSDPTTAIRVYRTLITQAPNQLEAYNNLAALLAAQGKAEEATEILETAIRLNPVFATLSDNLRALYLQQSQLHYKKALLLDTNSIKPLALATINQLGDAANLAAKKPIVVTTAATITPPPPPKPAPTFAPITETNRAAIQAPIQSMLTNWKNAWSQRDAVAFISQYVNGYRAKFDTPGNWQQSRHTNFNSKADIRIEIDQLEIQPFQSSRARATFNQSYWSDGYSDKIRKRLYLRKVGEQWKIEREITLKAL